MEVGQIVGRLWERQLTEGRQRAGTVRGRLTDRVIVVAVELGPARVDVSVLLFLVSHASILAGAACRCDTGGLLYAGQQ